MHVHPALRKRVWFTRLAWPIYHSRGQRRTEIAMRVVWKLPRSKKLLGALLAALSFLFFVWSLSTNSERVSEADVFYDDDNVHQFIVDWGARADPKPFQRVVEDPVEFIPNRKRTLMTAYGIVEVNDLSFVPVKPLKKGQSLLKLFSEQTDSDLNNILFGSKSRDPNQDLGTLRQQDPDAIRFYSILKKMKEKNDLRGVNIDNGGRNDFLNSEKMLALQAQMRERELQAAAKKGSDTHKNGEMQSEHDIAYQTKFNGTGCQKRLCAEFLTSFDLPHYRYCMKKSRIHSDRELPESQCNFLNASGRNSVALASHPGSGHLLVRELLQKSTGLCTGGVNCDVRLRRNGYPGECLRSGVVLVVKTHQTEPRWTGIQYDNSIPYKGFNKIIDIPVYGSAILLVRNPYDAIADLWQWMKREDTITDERWNDFVIEQGTEWQQIMLAWTATSHNHPLLIVKYEDLIEDTSSVLMEMLDFLQVPYSSSAVQELAMNLNVEEISLTYTSDERDYINSIIKGTIESLRTSKLDTDCNLSLYILD